MVGWMILGAILNFGSVMVRFLGVEVGENQHRKAGGAHSGCW